MKYFFIINPAAGKKNGYELYGEQIRNICKSKDLSGEILLTERPGHATEIALNLAEAAAKENPVRIFSAGGDGTFSEVVRGVLGAKSSAGENIELGCIPCGSGNDYIRNFGLNEGFLNIDEYITSHSVPVDAIKVGNDFAINICSMGLDAMIAHTANQIKIKNKRMSGEKAYNKAVIKCITGKLYNKLRVTIDKNERFDGKYIFSLAASGQYYGSGFHAAPNASPSDGLLDFVLIKKVSHLKAITLIGKYKDGSYVNSRAFRKILIYRRGREMTVESKREIILNLDGECKMTGKVSFEIMPSAIRFIVPPAYPFND